MILMKKLLTFIFLGLLVTGGIEVTYLYFLAQKARNQSLRKVENLTNIAPTPTPLPSYKQYQQWQPNVVALIANPSQPDKIEYNVLALIESIDKDKKQIKGMAADNKVYLFQITPATIFYTVSLLPNQPPLQKQEGSFADLNEDQVVLFTWQSAKKTDNFIEPILVSSIMTKK